MINKEQFKELVPWCVSAYKVGSSVLPWIENSRDTDYCIYVKDIHNTKMLAKLYQYKGKSESVFCRNVTTINNIRIYSYVEWFREKLFGEDVPMLNIFEHIDEYKQCLVNHGYEKDLYLQKYAYHILTGIYMLENGDYTLTEEQIKKVQLCHDVAMTPEIHNFIQEKLGEYKNEVC